MIAICDFCGKSFVNDSDEIYCSSKCADAADDEEYRPTAEDLADIKLQELKDKA